MVLVHGARNTAIAKLRIPSSLDIQQHRVSLLPMTYTTNALHAVVFVQRLSAWRSCQDRFFSRFPENGPPFPRHDMAWHGIVVSCRIPPRSAGHPTLPDLVPLRITSPLRPRSASVPAPSALKATSVLHSSYYSSASTTGSSTSPHHLSKSYYVCIFPLFAMDHP